MSGTVTKRILIVEDQILLRNLLIRVLQRSGYSVIHAVGTGTEAFTFLGQHSCDLIILDMTLPDISGKNFMTELEKKNIATPVIQISGDEAQFTISAQVKRTLAKPFNLEEILAAVDQS